MPDEITRPELDAKIAASEARMDTKFKGVEGSINLLGEKIDRLTTMQQTQIDVAHSTRTQTVLAILAAVLGMFWALYQFVPAEIQKTISAFESGRTTGKAESTSTAKGELTTPPAPPNK